MVLEVKILLTPAIGPTIKLTKLKATAKLKLDKHYIEQCKAVEANLRKNTKGFERADIVDRIVQ